MDMQPVARTTAIDLMHRGSFNDPHREIVRLSQILAPTTEADALNAISFMFKCLPMAAKDDEAKKILRQGYLLALKGYPQWAIVEARDAFIAGRVEGYTSSFAPNPADLGREVGKRVSDYQAKLQRLRRENPQGRVRDDRPVAPYVPPSLEPPRGFTVLNLDGKTSFTHDEAKRLHDTKRLPVGASWKARTGQIFMPVGSELKPGISEAEAGAEDFNPYPDRDEWERIHAPKVTPEEWAMREAAE